MHDACLWLLSLELARFSGRGTMITLSSECATHRRAELSPFQGLAFGYFVLGLFSRQGRGGARRVLVALACELWRSFQVVALWSLRVASAADRCAKLSPLPSITAPCGQRCQGLQRLDILCFGSLVRQSR